MQRYSIIFLFFFFASIFYCSCGEYEVLEIERQAKRQADSLFRAHKDSLIRMSDTLCDDHFDSYFQVSKDSIFKIQMEKINELLEK